ncbi:MAG: hypothetical protein JNM79_19980 [Burkholderiales bacterium]|nr:hypothetical protein [Burkholderiales bacterium]
MVAAPLAASQTLRTASFDVTIDVRCAEGEVSCSRVRYTGVSRKTGKSITLNGRTLHTTCADGRTPCRFLGYVFRNGSIVYTVWENGMLSVKDGERSLVEEQGEWK